MENMSENEIHTENTDVANKRVRATYSWRPSNGGRKYSKTSTFDFAGVTHEDLINLAMKTIIIKIQSLLRDLASANPNAPIDDNAFSNVHVLDDIINANRRSSDPTAAAIRHLKKAGLSDADLAEVVAKLPPRVVLFPQK